MNQKHEVNCRFQVSSSEAVAQCHQISRTDAQRLGASTRRLSPRRSSRRRGQALLLAVLLMVFAALLGSTFVTVVALNLSQTARSESKRDAELAARAGVQITNSELTNSAQGENWRPEQLNPPPAPTDIDFDAYYSPFEKAQGWVRTAPARTTAQADYDGNGVPNEPTDEWKYLEDRKRLNGDRVFVKVPDPRLPSPRSKTPTYLVEIAPVTNDPDKNGMLRLTVVGRSDDNDAAFSRSIAYKGTSFNGGPFSFARYDSNYDTARKKLRVANFAGTPAQITAHANPALNGTTEVKVDDASIFQKGQTVIVTQGKVSGAKREVAIVAEVDTAATPDSLYLTTGPGVGLSDPVNDYPYTAGSKIPQVRAASSLMTALPDDPAGKFDADGDGVFIAVRDSVVKEHAPTGFGAKFSTNGMYFGSGVALDSGPSIFQLGGRSTTATTRDDDLVLIAGQVAAKGTNAVKLRESPTDTEVDFPVSGANRSGVTTLVRDDLSDDEEVRRITPPLIEGEAGKLSRYLELTKFSDVANGSQQGYGPGLYIDNKDENELAKLVTAPVTEPARAMPVRVMHRLWQRKADAAYGGTLPGGPTGRGWLNNYHKFLPHATLIELKGDTIIVTRDHVSYSPTLDKAWKTVTRADGTVIAPGAKSHRMVMAFSASGCSRQFGPPGYETTTIADNRPFNGVIFAEGNVRVRGWVNNKDITVVSMGNIYIEGNLVRRTATGRIALLAKKNVVLNPTQFITQPDGWEANATSTATALAIASGATSVEVASVDPLRVGTAFQFANATTGAVDYTWRVVRTINTLTKEITFAPQVDQPIPSGTILRPLNDPVNTTGATPIDEHKYDITALTVDKGKTLVRDVRFDSTTATGHSLVWRHGGQQIKAFDFKNTNSDAIPANGTFYAKKDNDANNSIIANLINPTLHEKTFSSTINKLPTPETKTYDLLDVNEDLVRGGDAVETLKILADRYSWRQSWHGASAAPPVASGLGNDDAIVDNAEEPNKDWDLLLPGRTVPPIIGGTATAETPSPLDDIAARRIAALPSTGSALDVFLNAGEQYPVPLTVSVGAFWTASAATSAPYIGGIDSANIPIAPTISIGSPFYSLWNETPETVVEGFYQDRATLMDLAPAQAALSSTQYVLSANNQTSNLMAFRSDYDYTSSLVAPAIGALPNYYMTEPKLERGAWGTTPYVPVDIKVEAIVYAQEGSWFVIPVPLNPEIKVVDRNGDLDFNDPGEMSSSVATAESTRFRRQNYRIQFIGTIAQNMTPTGLLDYDAAAVIGPSGAGDTVSGGRGAMAQWLDATSYPTDFQFGAGNSWMSIYYEAKPLDKAPTSTDGRGLYLPVSPDLMYVG